MTVGSTTSATWSVTTGTDSCAGITTVGAVCPDGTVYAGITPDGNKKMMVTRCDAGMTWGGSSCTGTATLIQWVTAPTGVITGYNSWVTGKTNTDGLAQLFNADSPYVAAKYCYDLDVHGHSDWYLPAADEATFLALNSAALNFVDDYNHWTSTEFDDEDAPWNARGYNLLYDYATWSWKNDQLRVRCIRTD